MPGAAATTSAATWAIAAHCRSLVVALLTSWFAGFAGVLGAGVVYLLKRNDSAFVGAHAREAINFNLSMFIYTVAALAIGVALGAFTVLTLGIGLLLTAPATLVLLLVVAIVAVLWLVCSVIAAVKAWNGEAYRYPLALRLLS